MPTDNKNSIWLASQFIISILSSFVIIKICLSYFGEELFGIWLLFTSFWGLGTFIDLGFGTGIIRFIAQANKLKNRNDMQVTVFTGLIIFLVGGLLIFFLGNLLSGIIYINNKNLVSDNYLEIAHQTLFLLSINFLFSYISIFLKSILEGMSDFVSSSKLTILYNILLLAAVIFIVQQKLNLIFLAYAYISVSFIILLNLLFLIKRKYNIIRLNWDLFSLSKFITIFKYSFSVQIATIFGALIDPTIKYVIGNFSSLSIVSYYEIARRFTSAATGLFNTTFKNYLPKASILSHIEEWKSFILTEGVKLSRLGAIYSGFVFGVCQILLASVIKVVFGIDEIIIIFLILVLSEIVNNIGYSLYLFLLGIGKTNYLALIQAINLIITVIAVTSGFILFNSKLGLLAYFPSVIIGNVLMLMLIKRDLSISIKMYFQRIEIGRIISLLIIISIVIPLIYTSTIPIFVGLFFISASSCFIFISDLKNLYNQFLLGISGRL